MFFDITLHNKILIFFKNFTKKNFKKIVILRDFRKKFQNFFVKLLKKIKILLCKVMSKNMCRLMDSQKNDFENFHEVILMNFYEIKFQIAISLNFLSKEFIFLHFLA